MAGNTVTTFAGFLKTNYARKVVNTIPEDLVMQRDCPFGEAEHIGEQYQQSVITKLEQGGTYSRGGQGAFALNTPVAGAIEKALVDGSQFVLTSGIDYETLSKALANGKLAYGSSGDMLMKNMAQSARKRLEIDLWIGQSTKGLGEISAVATNDVTFTAATWCPSYWIGMEDAVCEFFNAALGVNRGTASVVSVNIATRTVTFTTLPGGVIATDIVFYKDQREAAAWNSLLGLVAMAGTSAGNLFNIAVTKSIWGPNQYNVGGAMSFAVCQDALVTSAYKGLMGGATLYLAVSSWNNLLTEQAALRRYGGEFDGRVELINGGTAISFQTMVGKLIIKPTIYLQDGYAVIVPNGSLVRVGSTDITFEVPGMNEPLLTVGGTTAGITLQCYYNQALFCPEPGKLTQLYGITV